MEREGARVGLPPGNDKESVDKVGKPGDTVTELRDMLTVGLPPGSDRDDKVTLSEMLGKLGDTVTELRDVLRPVGITTDVLGTLRLVVSDSVGKLRDSVGELSEGIVEPSVVSVVRPELRDTAGKVTDVLSTFDNELIYRKSVDRVALEGLIRVDLLGLQAD